ncbi:MAG: isoprenylcysteine carboxyl methyltransferase family protein [Porphyromonadaceae bacterium]|nr:isoprenylcysteine carboxyl methyltransferase family protein [Porphyromonadaceae bacterium]
MFSIFVVFGAFFAVRLMTLAISIRNEKRLISLGAKQYGAKNSLLLTLAHTAYYIAALVEAYLRSSSLDATSWAGIGVMLFAYVMLFYVIYCLRDIWTVKVYIAPNHRIERSLLFRVVRHPNYFLNIIPELIGVALLCHSWYTLVVGLPIYCIILAKRIRIESEAMKALW